MSGAHEEKGLSLTLKVWRQRNAGAPGAFETHQLDGISPHCSFLEMLDVLNDRLVVSRGIPLSVAVTVTKFVVRAKEMSVTHSNAPDSKSIFAPAGAPSARV